jgi:hypothetical protein
MMEGHCRLGSTDGDKGMVIVIAKKKEEEL